MLWKWPWTSTRMMTVCASSNSPASSIHFFFSLSHSLFLFKWEPCRRSSLLYIYSDFRYWIVADPDGLLFVYFTFFILHFFSSSMTRPTNFIITDIYKLVDELTNLFHKFLFLPLFFLDVNLKLKKKRTRIHTYLVQWWKVWLDV